MADDYSDLLPSLDSVTDVESLYDADILAWCELQAAALRARRAGDAILDWDNLAEEIEDLGKSQLQGCESQLENIIEHLLKLEYVRSPRDYPHWRGEIRPFRTTLAKRITQTIRNRLLEELDGLHLSVVKALLDRELDGFDRQAAELVHSRPYTWAQITDEDWLPEARTGLPPLSD